MVCNSRYVLALIFLLFCSLTCSGENILVDRFAAKVGEDIIFLSDVKMEKALLLSPLSSGHFKPEELTRNFILNRLIERNLLIREANRFITLHTDDIEAEIAKSATKVGGMDPLKTILAQIGMTFEEFKQRVRDNILLRRYIDQRIRSFIVVSDKSITEYIKQNREELGLNGAAGTNSQTAGMKELRQRIALLLQEKAVNERLNALVEKLREQTEIRTFYAEGK